MAEVAAEVGNEGMVAPAVIGHSWAVDLLARQISLGCLGHTYLLTGPPQVGKGRLARWFAQALLCEAAEPPCGVCPSCQRAAAGIHPDLRALNLEAQSGGRRTLGIEAVREMRRGMAERPFCGARKVYILEDAESMTVEAANALLKTLEEPPPFVVLLLVALSDHALLPTIVSRCRVLPLRPLARGEVRQALIERWGAAEETADLLAALSHGRPGWAIQALQDGGLLKRREESLAALTALLGAGLAERFAFAEKQEGLWRRGQHQAVVELLVCWQGWWRDLLLLGKGCPEMVVNIDQVESLRAALGHLSSAQAASFLRALCMARQYLTDQVNPRLVFEDLLLYLPSVVW